jgi:chemotaxis signal transduction protein
MAAVHGVLRVGDVELAVDCATLQAVHPWPARLEPCLAGTGEALGLFDSDGLAIPLFCLRRLLGLPAAAEDEPRRVAVLATPQGRIALATEGIGEMLRIAPEEVQRFVPSRGIVAGVVMRAGSTRMLQLLDAAALVAMPGVLAVRGGEEGRQAARRDAGGPLHVAFTAAGFTFCVPATAIHRLVAPQELIRGAIGDRCYRGRFTLRGVQVPVFGLAALLGLPEAAGDASRIIVMQAPGGSFGLQVTEVLGLHRLADSALLPMPALLAERRGLLRGAHRLAGQADGTPPALLVDDAALRGLPEIAACLRLFSGLTRDEEAAASGIARGLAQAFLRIEAGAELHVPLAQVAEVIALPVMLVTEGFARDAVLGMAEHRGTLMPVLDLGLLLFGTPTAAGPGCRVLVRAGAEGRIGYLVEAMRAIEHLRLVPGEARLGRVRAVQERIAERGASQALVLTLDLDAVENRVQPGAPTALAAAA